MEAGNSRENRKRTSDRRSEKKEAESSVEKQQRRSRPPSKISEKKELGLHSPISSQLSKPTTAVGDRQYYNNVYPPERPPKGPSFKISGGFSRKRPHRDGSTSRPTSFDSSNGISSHREKKRSAAPSNSAASKSSQQPEGDKPKQASSNGFTLKPQIGDLSASLSQEQSVVQDGEAQNDQVQRQVSVVNIVRQSTQYYAGGLQQLSMPPAATSLDSVLNEINQTSPRKKPEELQAKDRSSVLTVVKSEGTGVSTPEEKKRKEATTKVSKTMLLEFEKEDEPEGSNEEEGQKKKRLSQFLVNHYIANQKTKIEQKKEEVQQKVLGLSLSPDHRVHSSSSSNSRSQISQSRSSFYSGEEKNAPTKFKYPPGFTSADDLDGDGIIDPVEQQIKVELTKNQIRDEIEERIKKEYLAKFKKEVDFHHKLAYKFDRAYRLGKRNPDKQTELDLEIIDLLTEFSEYIQHDPLVLFYCLFFCIFYNNAFLVEFLRRLIFKLKVDDKATLKKLDYLLEFIDVNGLERARRIGESVNQKVYHIVMYQAFDDKLRVIYSKIIKKLQYLQLRSDDALHLLKSRDYELIREVLTKFVTKVSTAPIFKFKRLIAHSYRKYNPAYFEEVLLDLTTEVDSRVAQNYRERFLIGPQAIYEVLYMYSKKDYMDNFLEMDDINQLTKAEFIELFTVCIRHDAFKLGFQLYCRYLRGPDITSDIMKKLLFSLKDSMKFTEIKLFFIHEHFDVFDVETLSSLIDTMQGVLNRTSYNLNFMLSCYNPVKVALLIYKVCHRIQMMNLYSLITRCEKLKKHVETSLCNFLHYQTNIGQLYSFMTEPILNLKRQEDSLDIMLKMNMATVLNHPVLIEVLNLVYEGKYSIDTSPLYLSQTFNVFFNTSPLEQKSQRERLIQNIRSLSSSDQPSETQKQFSLQFHIWKHCIYQRLLDETFFIIIIFIIYFYQTLQIELYISEFLLHEKEVFGHHLSFEDHELEKASQAQLQEFCPIVVEQLIGLSKCLTFLAVEDTIISFSMLTSVLQKLAIKKLKDNAPIDKSNMVMEFLSSLLSFVYLAKILKHEVDPTFTNTCAGIIHVPESDIEATKHGFYYMTDLGHFFSYQIIISCNVFVFAIYTIMQLKRTQQFGYVVIMITEMTHELYNFFSAFGILILVSFTTLRFTISTLKSDGFSFYDSLVDVIDTFVGKPRLEQFKEPYGVAYSLTMSYFSKMFLFSFMVAMFILKYASAWSNIEAKRRMEIIKLKNSQQYDPQHGAITMSYFPINLFLLPFLLPLIMAKSKRFSSSILEIQYYILIFLYIFTSMAICIPLMPLLYLKIVLNSGYHLFKKRHTTRKPVWLRIFNFLFTIVGGPFIILGSMVTDLAKLNGIVMRDEKHFEFKYPKPNLLKETSPQVIMKSFFKTFIIDYQRKYKNQGKTEYSIMFMHRKLFNIVDNYHSFFCRGDKSYEEACFDINLYNLTKILGRQCSIPSKTGEKRQDYLNYDVIACVFEDIVMFNYCLFCTQQYKAGVPFESINGLIYKYGYAYRNYDMKAHLFCQSLTRDPSDFFNFFCISQVTKAFTDVQEIARVYQRETNFMHEKKQSLHVNRLKQEWQERVMNSVDEHILKIKGEIEGHLAMSAHTRKLIRLRDLKRQITSITSVSKAKNPWQPLVSAVNQNYL